MKVKLTLEYDGSAFSGWQKQGTLPQSNTVQGALEMALSVFLESEYRKHEIPFVEPVKIQGASRTDAGVHAECQVVSFSCPDELELDMFRLAAALNALTPRAIGIVSAKIVAEDFDARFTPHRKLYQYQIFMGHYVPPLYDGRAWVVHLKLNIPDMIRAAKLIVGKHDFSAFRAINCNAKTTERTITESEFTRVSDHLLVYTIVGNGFLKQMVRIIVGTLVEVGHSKRTVDSVSELFTSLNRNDAGRTAPACGLYLRRIDYGDNWYYK